MFTGLIEETAKVENIKKTGDVRRIRVKTARIASKCDLGGSIAVNGVCLTIVKKEKNLLYFEAMGQTFQSTNLRLLRRNDMVNLESALSAEKKIDGHFVQGHVDGTVKIKKIKKDRNGLEFTLNLAEKYKPFIVTKGSVALDGVSLTVQKIYQDSFSVYLIPHTLEKTIFKTRKAGHELNLEVDILSKYAKSRGSTGAIDYSFLKNNGF